MRRIPRMLLGPGCLSLMGCATLFSGGTRPLTVTSNPAGLTVLAAGVEAGTTPATVRLRRSRAPYDVRVIAPGGDTVAVPVPRHPPRAFWLNVLWGGWGALAGEFGGASPVAGFMVGSLWPSAIDLLTGAAYAPATRTVHVDLAPSPRPPLTPLPRSPSTPPRCAAPPAPSCAGR